jgi:hypothetical protein
MDVGVGYGRPATTSRGDDDHGKHQSVFVGSRDDVTHDKPGSPSAQRDGRGSEIETLVNTVWPPAPAD